MDVTLRENQSYFVLDALSVRQKHIKELAEMMASSRKSIDKYIDADKARAQDCYLMLKKAHGKLIQNIRDCRLYLSEIGEDELSAYSSGLAAQLSAFNLMTPDYTTLTRVLSDFAAKLPEKQTANAAVIARCMNAVRMGYYPTDLTNIGHIMRGISFPDGVVTNLLDPCCGEGLALKKLAVGNNCMTYGAELDEGRANAAQGELHRVAFGSFFNSRISHEAFHAVLLNPPYLSVMTEGGNRVRDEKRFLVEILPHLMMGGLLIYIVPYYRLTPDICRILCDNFTNISVYRFTDDEFKKFSQIAVLGTRIKRINGAETADKLAEYAFRKDSIPCVTEITEARYALPAKPKNVELFKGAVFNKAELARQLRESKSLDKLITSSRQNPASCTASGGALRSPPLPFTFSQLGLIGGSGLINGLIECDYPHVIKGRIVKEVRTESTENHNRRGELMSTEIKEKIVNKMVFNILTPDGFKALA